MSVKTQNQINPPLPKKKRVDNLGNSRKRVWVKSGTSTMLLCKGLTVNAAEALILSIRNYAERLGTTVECEFRITQ